MQQDKAPLWRVLLFDNEHLFRNGLARILASLPYVDVVEEARDAGEALQKAGAIQPDLVLFEPGSAAGFCLISELKDSVPSSRVVVLTHLDDEESITCALRCGVDGYILKNIDADDLVTMIDMLRQGVTLFSPGVADKVAAKFRWFLLRHYKQPFKSVGLSPRQKEVLALLEKGLSNKEIAAAMAISPNTVKNHIQCILKKLEVENRTHAVSQALSQYDLDIDSEP